MFDSIDISVLSAEAMARSSVILAVGLLLFISALLCIRTILAREELKDCVGCYLVSLSLADLICATIIIPLSIYSALVPSWKFGGNNSIFCKGSAYLEIVLLSSTIYTFAWIGVDRYAALHKPSRYEAEQTATRCKCWIVFSWLTAFLLACPIMVAKMEVAYIQEAEMCILRWTSTKPYSLTLAGLVLLPSCFSIVFTFSSIISSIVKTNVLEDSQRMLLETDHNFILSFFILICFILSWLPLIILQLIPLTLVSENDFGTMTFVFVWLALGGPTSKILIYLFINPEFRRSFTRRYTWCCCVEDDDDQFQELQQYENSSTGYGHYL
ncbi:Dopamine/Ecdysteroid receptor [Strongyloides ratti]|uniref:Dopamine/Ecdysteroid receptor n=1 Tax=Strongyloides ratti TaxID=34506 RepID=A0A090LLG0_STRRB|nr:Dopamine/Ecdysteroid receptor [Strongyloides ratti]CEF70555.1 Dopamine/Ecdysteroid receptor [Strongyloides ratti]